MRQESYRAEFGSYADVGAAWNPTVLVAGAAVGWPTVPGWQQLGARPDGHVRFQYQTRAGFPGGPLAPPAGLNLPPNDFWFYADAQADLDGDAGGACSGPGSTTCVFFEVLSHSDHVWCNQGKGWE
jgi:hypothetical protein